VVSEKKGWRDERVVEKKKAMQIENREERKGRGGRYREKQGESKDEGCRGSKAKRN
jgi:hypothetical protein